MTLLRVAGLPISMWLAASNPDLFALVRALDEADEEYRKHATALAERLGATLVPRPELPARDRRLVLSVRRRLHQGHPLDTGHGDRLRAIVHAFAPPGEPADELADELDRVARLSAECRRLERLAETRVQGEHERLLTAPWDLLGSRPGGPSCAAPEVAEDIERRLAKGEPWSTKRMRRRSDYLWRMIARGATKTTPRAWLGHVALAPAEHGPDNSVSGGSVSVNGQVAVDWVENVHTRRIILVREGLEFRPDHWLSLTPLHRIDGDELSVWCVELGEKANRMVTHQLRVTSALRAVLDALGSGARPVPDLRARLPETVPPGFLRKLVQLGLLDVTAPPRRLRGGWRAADAQEPSPTGTGFVDVYRRAEGTADTDVAALQRAFEQYRRLSALIKEGRPRHRTGLDDLIGARPRPVMEVYAEQAQALKDSGDLSRRFFQRGSWPEAVGEDTGYARLLGLISASLDRAGDPPPVVDITPAMLDAVGAGQAPITWPTDCTVRPLGGNRWVLDNSAPAAILDARFAETVRWLHGARPEEDAHREFLAELDRITGVPSVELLVPPLVEQAANAVRRPRYTSMWTGDPDPRAYGSDWEAEGARHLPLSELTVHREENRTVVAHLGRPLRICQHATRNALVPWNVLTSILCADSQQYDAHCLRLRCSLRAFPQRSFMPRITVGGSLTLSAAQWRIGVDRLDGVGGGDLAELRALTRLRDHLGLPRWIFVSGPHGDRPLPCDLESVRAGRVFQHALERLAERDGDEPPVLTVAEMLPAPDRLTVTDRGPSGTGQVAAEILIRLPHAVPPKRLAAVAALNSYRPVAASDACG
ncbi:lantibiotic dehydratase [Nonomuraea sp. NPDC050643]|uniref:lantibiotic dehydratase n=1 Tax=Nonomuraea sp. NPDC050643 TaxID=3155660 RepID=UPI0033D34D9B